MKEVYTSASATVDEIFMDLTDSDGDDRAAKAFIAGETGWEFCYNFDRNILGYGSDRYDWENAGDEWGEVDEIESKGDTFTFTVIQTVE